jgi:hypothetical protein
MQVIRVSHEDVPGTFLTLIPIRLNSHYKVVPKHHTDFSIPQCLTSSGIFSTSTTTGDPDNVTITDFWILNTPNSDHTFLAVLSHLPFWLSLDNFHPTKNINPLTSS